MKKYVRNFEILGETIYIPESKHMLKESKRYYIDGVNGNDSNGGSQSAPLKTFDKFLEICENAQSDIRCYIVHSGTYTASKNSYTGIALHITATVPNVVINFDGTDGTTAYTAFYGCHINIQGGNDFPITIGSSNNGYWYADGGGHWFKNCKFTNEFRFYGCGCLIERCTVIRLRAYWSVLKLNHNTYGANYTDSIIEAKETSCEFLGSDSNMVALTTDSPATAFDFEGGNVKLTATLELGTYKYAYSFALNGTSLSTTINRRNSIATVGRNDMNVSNGAQISNNALLYGYDTSGTGNTTLRGGISSYNCITLKVKQGSSFYYEDVPNPSYSSNISEHTFSINDVSATVSFTDKTMTISSNNGIRFDSVYGRNI